MLVRIEDGAEILVKKPGVAPVIGARLERGRGTLALRHGGGRSGVVDLS
jgi:hypothetical protein